MRTSKYILVGMIIITLVLSTTGSLGSNFVGNKSVENNIRSSVSRGAVLEVTTDKTVYSPGEPVAIFLTNIGDETLSGGGPIITIYNEEEEIVYQEATYCWHELEPGEYIEWPPWDQTNQQGQQVPVGEYVVEGFLSGGGENYVDNATFFISNAGDDVTIILDGIMGANGWYVSCVTISFVYDPEEIVAVYYNIDSGSWQIYTAPFEVCWDGEHTFCWYYIDKEGNQSAIECIEIKIDQIPPEINLTWETIDRNHILFTAICSDASSGIDRVEFALNDVPAYTDSTEPYEWLIYYLWPNYIYKATAFDNAGNSAFDILEDSDIYSYSSSQSSITQQSSHLIIFKILDRLMNRLPVTR